MELVASDNNVETLEMLRRTLQKILTTQKPCRTMRKKMRKTAMLKIKIKTIMKYSTISTSRNFRDAQENTETRPESWYCPTCYL